MGEIEVYVPFAQITFTGRLINHFNEEVLLLIPSWPLYVQGASEGGIDISGQA